MKINIDNYELYFLRYIEGRLSDEERREVETFLIKHPDLKEIMDMYDPFFTLAKDEELVFDDKDSLMHPTKSSFVMPLWVRYASVAAVALFVVSVGLVWMQRQQPTQNIVLADNAIDIDIIEEKYVPMISDSIIDGEKLEEVISTTRNVIRHEAQIETMSMLAQAEEKTVELEQQPIELEPEQEYIDTTIYMYDNVSSEVYYAENVMEETTNMMEIGTEEIVIIDTYTDCLVAYTGSRCGEKVIEQQEIVANGYIVDSTTAKEPMSMINQLKEVVSTLSRNKRKEVEAEWTEYSNYALVAYNEGKRELTNYLEQQINKYIN